MVDKPSATGVATGTTTYKYDALGRRIEINANGAITRYVYNGSNIFLEFDGDNIFKARYIHNKGIDRPLLMEREGSPYQNDSYARQDFYYHTDRLGSITEITNFAGEVVQRYVYDSFGRIKIYDDGGTEVTPSSSKYLKSPYTFTGQHYQPETGNYDFGFRTYSPETGTFISSDPIGFRGGSFNLYSYVSNNPLNFIDPEGLDVRRVKILTNNNIPHSILIVEHPITGGVVEIDYGPEGKFDLARTVPGKVTVSQYPFDNLDSVLSKYIVLDKSEIIETTKAQDIEIINRAINTQNSSRPYHPFGGFEEKIVSKLVESFAAMFAISCRVFFVTGSI